jgi:class 3 adenylate cyclase
MDPWVIALCVTVVGGLIVALVTGAVAFVFKWQRAPKNELLRLYGNCAARIFRLSRKKQWFLLRDRNLQDRILSPQIGLVDEWELLRTALRSIGADASMLDSPSPFYEALVPMLAASEHWDQRSLTLADQLKDLEHKALAAPTSTPAQTVASKLAGFPTGTITLLFTDIEGSSNLAATHGSLYEVARQEHFRLLREQMASFHGHEVSAAGDSMFVAFSVAPDAVSYAVAVQQCMLVADWHFPQSSRTADIRGSVEVPIRIRIGIHTGEALCYEEAGRPNYSGDAVNRASRITAAGHGGQILLSETTYRRVQNAEACRQIEFLDQKVQHLNGVGEEHLWQVCHPSLPHSFPPLRCHEPDRDRLPKQHDQFIGRKAQISTIKKRLVGSRLVTLTGEGGCGKTRLAVQIARDLLSAYDRQVWLIKLDQNKRMCAESLAIAREIDDKRVIGFAVSTLATIANSEGDYALARTLGEEAVLLWRETGDKGGEGWALNQLGVVQMADGCYDEAEKIFEQSLATWDSWGDKWGIARTLDYLGWAARHLGDNRGAYEYHVKAQKLYSLLGHKEGIARSLHFQSVALLNLEDLKASTELCLLGVELEKLSPAAK